MPLPLRRLVVGVRLPVRLERPRLRRILDRLGDPRPVRIMRVTAVVGVDVIGVGRLAVPAHAAKLGKGIHFPLPYGMTVTRAPVRRHLHIRHAALFDVRLHDLAGELRRGREHGVPHRGVDLPRDAVFIIDVPQAGSASAAGTALAHAC